MTQKRLLALLVALVFIAFAPGCTKVECKKSSDCSGATPVCDTTNNVCVTCLSSSDCSGTTPVCDTTDNVCLACLSSSDCSGSTPVCDTTNDVCVGCLALGDCSGSTPFCDASSSTCTASCANNTECATVDASTPLCDTSTHDCVECLAHTDCSGDTPICNAANNTCTASCTSSDECAAVDSSLPLCDTSSHLCVECLTADDCSGGTPSCDTSAGTCKASCTDSSTCAIDQDCNTSGSEGNFCQDVDVAAASTAITAIRTAASSGETTSTQTVANAIVTYLKPSVGGDPVGFTVQAEPAGPALFVAVDPATVGSGLQVGDRITFTADTLDYSGLGHVPNVTGISGFSLISSGHDVSALRTDISNIDVTGTITTDDSRLISLTFTVATDPQTANTGYMKAEITTAAYPTADFSYWYYAPSTVFANDDVTNGCNATITNGLLWRYGTSSYEDAEPANWQDEELTVNSCPAPTVLAASAMSGTEVDVTFDRNIDPDTLTAGAFTIHETDTPLNTLNVTGAAPGSDKRTVVLTTDTQGLGTAYTLTVDATVKDLEFAAGVDTDHNSATFNGYLSPAILRISEVNPNISGTNGGDILELLATTDGTLDGETIHAEVNSTTLKATLPPLIVAADDYILLHLVSSGCTETTSKDECPDTTNTDSGITTYVGYSDNAWDIVSEGSGYSYSSQVISVRGKDGNIMDAAAFANSNTAPSGFVGAVQMIEDGGYWTSLSGTCTDVASCKADAFDWTTTLLNDSTSSVERTDLSVPGSASQWQVNDGSDGHKATFGTAPL